MRAILPGRPRTALQAVATGCWDEKQIITYISGNAVVILDGPHNVVQTTYLEVSDQFVAIAFDELSGKIAAASGSTVHVYKPYGRDEGALQWSLQCHLPVEGDDTIQTLSWGLDQELLVGSSSLTLFSTYNSVERLWTKPLANPAHLALFSYDTSLIASSGMADKLVKVWRRLSLADQRFEYSYLPHPAVVTGMHWRRPFHREESFENVLYTICADNKLRVWSPGESHSHYILQLWAEIDLAESIQPRSLAPEDRSSKRYVLFVDIREFRHATEHAVQNPPSNEDETHALEHLVEVANRSPDICIVLDDRGNMSAWGLESVGSKHRKPGDIFNVAHVEGLKIRFDSTATGLEDNVQLLSFCAGEPRSPLSILAHHFDGRLEWYEARLDTLFAPTPQPRRLQLRAVWTGHSGPIKKVVRTATGRSLISRTGDNESIVWTQKSVGKDITISRQSVLNTSEHIHRVWLLQEGKFIVFLHHDSVSLWDARGSKAKEVVRRPFSLQTKPLCLLCIPEVDDHSGLVHLATISSDMKGVAWEVRLPVPGSNVISLEDFATFELGSKEDFAYVLPVDPAGTSPVISGFLDTFARDVAISYSSTGVIKSWTARPDLEQRKLDWLLTSTVETFIDNPSLASGTSIRKAALVDSDRTLLTIWNMRSAQLEHEERFENSGGIQDLDWSSTPDNQSILAVGFPHRIILYTQLRYDYLDSKPSWAVMREISTRELSPHPIGDSVWLGGGAFVIGMGNQLVVQDKSLPASNNRLPDMRLSAKEKTSHDIFSVVRRLNGPLPVYHPQFLMQTLLSGKLHLVQQILLKLWKKLKFYSDGDPFDNFMDMDIDEFWSHENTSLSTTKRELSSSYADYAEEEPEAVTEEVAASLNELLASRQVPLLSSREQFHLADVVECVGTVEKHRRAIDENASRFLLFFRQHVLRLSQGLESTPISWREITWAFHSGSQDIITDLVSRHYHGKMHWAQARESGMFMWMTDINALRAQFEVIARNEYSKSEDKNPADCSLYYLALKKKTVLIGLWRMATWNREQASTQKFLSNNFQEPRWKTAALKNAYALMGKRRFEYAAAFFLLAGNLKDAVSVLSNQHGDLQLAIAVARVYEGDGSPVLKEFLQEKVLPQAALENSRWLATWAFWMLGKRDKAVRALILPLRTVLSPPETPTLQSKLFLTDDPALVVIYKQLREVSLQTLRGALSVSPRAEWEFVMHTAELYVRMGCDLLALDLVHKWEFLTPPEPRQAPRASPTRTTFNKKALETPVAHGQNPDALRGFDIDPRKILRRRSSLVIADLPQDFRRHGTAHEETVQEETNGLNGMKDGNEDIKEDKKKEKEKKQPTQFAEPDANSLLDAFGF
ncbi:hypothetical protein EJ06DRAFT_488764 [Trichodelitschia bisporula]|uniref:RAVE complex protein Rav1 C-terminal domain-containing protein n=1 Tax=Trichodelitschia bisporula TaxID=703511 RepID=A0A6G1I6G4_9PEZI|nr:hypothetical protein EJ06DRAFT_488764 [Trichodelitschia bisporula]